MMSYSGEGGSFPFSKDELKILEILASERLCEMEREFASKDPYKYVELRQIGAKLSAYVFMMNNKGITSEVSESERVD